ncbi:hypothetical protein BU24DRAFT_406510 [Aaosphaeria arxii CBS 175.79]|uniref:Membrane anchor Opy2 N-terminal domain-containing protein n=1 Tax=Aaosphaeria arxii CBS 175.79 TaxID=1450172 RepID=A0A6A5Y373_9PLEO|nr:uncharacterized protein BU24DRAFT_406510 [Aaosphaeria arxii CBS 175.79]KAF2019898.1 hypothetical protein BU24DRAFT_406510 [Aaosphaeria arxii CBS 175.79]
MHMFLNKRVACPSGKLFYQCASPQYQGCCSVDACHSNGCPDDDQATTTSKPPSPTPTAKPSPPNATPTVETLASVEGDKTVYITVTHEPPTSTSLPDFASLNASSKPPIGPIVGGVVGGTTIIIISLLLLLFYRRKKRQNEQRRATLPPPYQTTTDPDMSSQLYSSATVVAGSETSEKAGILRDATSNSDSTYATTDPDDDHGAARSSPRHMRHRGSDSNSNGSNNNSSSGGDSLPPQLDGRMVRPMTEIGGGEVLGVIPELPAAELRQDRRRSLRLDTHIAVRRSMARQSSLEPGSLGSGGGGGVESDRRVGGRSQGEDGAGSERHDHVMSWMQLSSLARKDSSARLSQPHNAPDHSAAVWGNMTMPRAGHGRTTS